MLAILPELLMAIMACGILLVGVFSRKTRITFFLAQAAIIATIAVLIAIAPCVTKTVLFHGGFVLDLLAVVLKIFLLTVVFFVFLYVDRYNRCHGVASNEFFVLGLLSAVGMMVLVSSHSLLTIFLGAELLSLPTYAMVAMQRDQPLCIEAAMKYFIIGALASGLLLYGFSMIFGATQSITIDGIFNSLATLQTGHYYLLVFGLVFSIAGLAFKLGVAPFHFWVPDVYEGAPTSVTLFISTAPKLAAFGMAIRLLTQALPQLGVQWQEMLIVMAILSMGIGNLAAIKQTNLKRMLAYSSIAHLGYTLLGLIAMTPRGYSAAMFYMITYALMTLAAFGIIVLLNQSGLEVEKVDDLKALNNRHPWLAFLLLIVMFSLAGIPPLVGFIAKVGLLEALISVHLVWLAVVAILFAVIGAYYYLRVVKAMYFESLETEAPLDKIQVTTSGLVAISINSVVILLLGIFPGALFTLCHLAFF